MKSVKLFLLFAFIVVSNFAQTTQPAKDTTLNQITISDVTDSGFEDVQLSITGSFAQQIIVGKVVGVHDGDTATRLDER